MLRSDEIGTGLYGEGRYVSVWSMVDGFPRCPTGPMILASDDAQQIAQVIAVNRAVAAIAARAETAEAAARLTVQEPPPETMTVAAEDGEPMTIQNPAYAAWVAAGQVQADAAGDDDLQHLLRTRAGDLIADQAGVVEPAWTLSLPPLPPFDPLAQTADWHGGTWAVRPLSEAEAAIWPLRPPPVPRAVTRTQLRLALAARELLQTVDAAVLLTGSLELAERWQAATMERDSPHLLEVATALGLTSSDIDAIFREAAQF